MQPKTIHSLFSSIGIPSEHIHISVYWSHSSIFLSPAKLAQALKSLLLWEWGPLLCAARFSNLTSKSVRSPKLLLVSFLDLVLNIFIDESPIWRNNPQIKPQQTRPFCTKSADPLRTWCRRNLDQNSNIISSYIIEDFLFVFVALVGVYFTGLVHFSSWNLFLTYFCIWKYHSSQRHHWSHYSAKNSGNTQNQLVQPHSIGNSGISVTILINQLMV